MEFREYWHIIWQRRALIVPLVAITFIASLVLNLALPPTYKTDTTVYVQAVIPPPVPNAAEYYSPEYYRTIYSEYLADDLSELLKSEAFAEDVSNELGTEITPSTIANLTRTKKTHRLLDVQIVSDNPQQALAISEAYERVLNTKLDQYLAFLQANNGFVRIVNRPSVMRTNSLPLTAAEVGLRTIAGLLAAVGLAFVLEYVDDRLRDRREVESFLGTKVLAEIPSGAGSA
jgi:capsular polysaccharide biosynthesis protein